MRLSVERFFIVANIKMNEIDTRVKNDIRIRYLIEKKSIAVH